MHIGAYLNMQVRDWPSTDPRALEDESHIYKGLQFKVKDFSNVIYDFVVENGKVTSLKEIEPSGVFIFPRK